MFKKPLAISCAVAVALGTLGMAAAKADVPMPSLGAKVFADLTNIDQTNQGVKTPASGTGVDVKRFYLILNEKFDDAWSMKLETDATYNSGKQVDVYMKNAWGQYTFSKAFWVRLGESDMPWIPFDEGVYGYRFVENTLIDRLHFGNSADWGLNVGGDLAHGMVSYQVAAVNGGGYKNPTRSKDMDVAARVSVEPVTGVILALGGYSGKLGKDNYGASAPTVYHTASRVDALAAYVRNGVRVGVEYFSANDWNEVTKTASNKADGTSVFASYDFTPVWGVFGRWDQAKLSKDLAPGLKDQYFDLGVVTHPIRNVDVALVYKHEKVDGGPATATFATTNGSAFNEASGTYNEVGIWTQVAF